MGILVVAQNPEQVGGDDAISHVNETYRGRCEVLTINDESIAVLPNYAEAKAVASYAIKPDGGYGSVIIVEAPSKQVTHKTFYDWM